MKNDNYEFIDEEHLPCIKKMREAVASVKDIGPWIIDPIYGFLMDKNCEYVELTNNEGMPTGNLEFIAECNPRSVAYLLAQRDELLYELKENHIALCSTKDYVGSFRYYSNMRAIDSCEVQS